MVCTVCGTPGVNKSTCPLSLKDPKEHNWSKHYKASQVKKKKKVTRAKPKKKAIPQSPSHVMIHPSIYEPNKYRRPRFINSYFKIFQDMNAGYLYFLSKFRNNRSYKIPCSSFELTKISLKIDDPNFKLNLLLNLSKKQEMLEIIKVITDINRKLGTFVCDRVDFFTNPDYRIQALLDMHASAREKLIRFVINNREYHGGAQDYDTTMSLDRIIREQDRQYVSQQLNSLPQVKNTEIKSTKKISMLVKHR